MNRQFMALALLVMASTTSFAQVPPGAKPSMTCKRIDANNNWYKLTINIYENENLIEVLQASDTTKYAPIYYDSSEFQEGTTPIGAIKFECYKTEDDVATMIKLSDSMAKVVIRSPATKTTRFATIKIRN